MKMISRFLAVTATTASFVFAWPQARAASPFPAPGRAQLTPNPTPTLPVFPAPTTVTSAQPVALAPQRTAAPAASAQKEIPQWHGQQGGGSEFATQVVRSAKAWEGFWQRADQEVPRKLDEAAEMAVVVFAGERPTGGFVVKIVGTYVEQETLVVVYALQAPGPDTLVTQVITHPWGAAIVPRSDRAVVFRQAPSPHLSPSVRR